MGLRVQQRPETVEALKHLMRRRRWRVWVEMKLRQRRHFVHLENKHTILKRQFLFTWNIISIGQFFAAAKYTQCLIPRSLVK